MSEEPWVGEEFEAEGRAGAKAWCDTARHPQATAGSRRTAVREGAYMPEWRARQVVSRSGRKAIFRSSYFYLQGYKQPPRTFRKERSMVVS